MVRSTAHRGLFFKFQLLYEKNKTLLKFLHDVGIELKETGISY